MMRVWEVDASKGGGQLVRTALSIAALRGRPCRVRGIRAGRGKPGLRRQHLAAVRALAEAVEGTLEGAQLGSLELYFEPGPDDGPLDLRSDIGTAGSTTLVLQALLPLLVRRGGCITVTGGTDNPLAPPVDYTRELLCPALAEVGVEVDLELHRRGYYPTGGGELRVRAGPLDGWAGFDRCAWGAPRQVAGIAYSSGLPDHVCERMRDAAVRVLRKGPGLPADEKSRLRTAVWEIALDPGAPSDSPGAGIVLWVEDEAGRRIGASALGERGKPAEEVGEEAATALLATFAAGAPCDPHLGDQLAVWAALADSPSSYLVAQLTEHLGACLSLLHEGLGARWSVRDNTVRITPSGTAT